MNSKCLSDISFLAGHTKSIRRSQSVVIGCFVVAVQMCISAAAAGPQTIQPFNTGWYSHDPSGYLHQPANTNFIVGHSDGESREYRNFFVFDLSTIHEPIVSATFQADLTYYGASVTTGNVGTWNLYDVTTGILSLNNATTPGTTFDDLGTGQSFGVLKYTRGDNSRTVTVNLNSAAIASMNASGGGDWAFGGRVDDLGSGDDILFNGSDLSNSNPRLLINIPEPASFVAAFVAVSALSLTCRPRRLQRCV